ncbi:lipase (class 3) domain-containing protein [Hirsutella rhossiliensis]|uniref:Lipase (Class 3) domain-containing protein n=1 Tax=Hirsutella rhossiliensis TaxID=111463 RepID=A0A9P8SCX6_9HYPO|nr:lipase (class 3) domain-containing protein [Hirsutella rhossiliensis]KAH0957349.1 lipase (class 3) domain-containing protein [Hirsutella rhossiliensis]
MVLLAPLLFAQLLVSPDAGMAHKIVGTEPAPYHRRTASISTPLFTDLERLSRIVDISYCVGNTGVRKPFECLSRCSDFPELSLVATWNTGVLLSDSCGYIAVDDGRQDAGADGPGGDVVSSAGRGVILVAFRGTYSITNTVVDLSTIPQQYVPYPSPDDGDEGPPGKPKHECANCTAHMGFLQSWRSARKVVLPELKALKAKYPSLPIHLVGHSLGGAVACLAALELRLLLGWDDVLVTTFGEPRVGNYQLARFVDKVFGLDGVADPESLSYRRVTHNDDPVPLLPWDEWGYRSHAGEIYITKPSLSPTEQDIRACAGDNDPACSTGAGGRAWQIVRESLLRLSRAGATAREQAEAMTLPTRLRLWQLFFAHRDYFWRLGLCVPGGDPANWGRAQPTGIEAEEL